MDKNGQTKEDKMGKIDWKKNSTKRLKNWTKKISENIHEKIWLLLGHNSFLHLCSAWLELMGLSNKVTLYNNLHKNNQRLIKTLEQILQDKFFSNFCAPWLLTSVNLHFIYHLRTKKSQKIFFRKKILSAYLDGFCSRLSLCRNWM